jgi:hypothetical protein
MGHLHPKPKPRSTRFNGIYMLFHSYVQYKYIFLDKKVDLHPQDNFLATPLSRITLIKCYNYNFQIFNYNQIKKVLYNIRNCLNKIVYRWTKDIFAGFVATVFIYEAILQTFGVS